MQKVRAIDNGMVGRETEGEGKGFWLEMGKSQLKIPKLEPVSNNPDVVSSQQEENDIEKVIYDGLVGEEREGVERRSEGGRWR